MASQKIWIVYNVGLQRGLKFPITPPYGWEDMAPAERKSWAQNVVRRKSSLWEYVQIDGLPY